jgi:hypothetical protein
VTVQRADADASAPGDFFQADVDAGRGEGCLRIVDEQLPVAGAVSARFAGPGELRLGVDRISPDSNENRPCKTEDTSVY